MTIRGVLFDKDGTLLDFHATWIPACRSAAMFFADGRADRVEALLRAGGWDERTGRVRPGTPFAAGSNRDIAEVWAALMPPHLSDIETIASLLDEMFMEGAEPAPVGDLAALFGELSGLGLKLGIATNDSAGGAQATLAPFGVLDLLDFVAGYDSGHGAKPGPGMVHGFCTAVGLAAGEVMVVGDNRHDLEMGRAAGVGLKVGVLTGTSGREELAGLADHLLDSVMDLPRLLG